MLYYKFTKFNILFSIVVGYINMLSILIVTVRL